MTKWELIKRRRQVRQMLKEIREIMNADPRRWDELGINPVAMATAVDDFADSWDRYRTACTETLESQPELFGTGFEEGK